MKNKSTEQDPPKKKKKKKAKKVQPQNLANVSIDVTKEMLSTENVTNDVPVSDDKTDDHVQETEDTAVSYLLIL